MKVCMWGKKHTYLQLDIAKHTKEVATFVLEAWVISHLDNHLLLPVTL